MRCLTLLLLLIVLAGCARGPDATALKESVSARIADALPAETVSLVELERRGSQSATNAPRGETRRVVYFDADLKLQRDFDFGAWDSPGVAGLVSALGAGPRGIVGITNGGNKAGDVIRAHGTAVFKREGEGWTPVTSAGYSAPAAPAYATSAAPDGAAAVLESLRKVVDTASVDASPATRVIIEEELAAARASIRARLARVADGYAIAAGPEHGQYLRFANALSNSKGGARIEPLVTRGGEENVRLLRERKASLALAQGDAASDAYQGIGSFEADGPYTGLRAMGNLFPEPVHVLVRVDSKFTSFADLRGRRIAIGEQGSASRTTALRVLSAHGFDRQSFSPVEGGLGEALVMLRQGQVDAVMQVIGMPSDSIRRASAEIPLRLLPLSERAVETLATAKTGYFAFTIPAGTYATQKQSIRTLATAALLLVGDDLSEAEVAALTRLVFEKGRDLAAQGSAQGAQVSPATARQGLPVPLHRGAAKTLDGLLPAVAADASPAR